MLLSCCRAMSGELFRTRHPGQKLFFRGTPPKKWYVFKIPSLKILGKNLLDTNQMSNHRYRKRKFFLMRILKLFFLANLIDSGFNFWKASTHFLIDHLKSFAPFWLHFCLCRKSMLAEIRAPNGNNNSIALLLNCGNLLLKDIQNSDSSFSAKTHLKT